MTLTPKFPLARGGGAGGREGGRGGNELVVGEGGGGLADEGLVEGGPQVLHLDFTQV